MRFAQSVVWLVACIAWQTTSVWAHPGHGTEASPPDVWTHYLVEPVHVMQIGVLLLAAACAVLWVRAKCKRRVALELGSK